MQFLYQNRWLFGILAILFATALIVWIEEIIYYRLKDRFHKTKRIWDDSFLIALHKPLFYFIWVIGLSILLTQVILYINFGTSLLPYFNQVRQILFVIFLLWFAFRYIHEVEHRLFTTPTVQGKHRDKTTVRAIAQVIRIFAFILALTFVLQIMGKSITALLTFGGIGALAVGFAAKDTLANFIGGMMIYWDRPFSVGDWIRSPDRNIEGYVEHIGWRLTRIRTMDKRPLYVPNMLFSTISVENPSRMFNRRIYATIGLRYDDAPKVESILKDVKEMLVNHPGIDTSQTLMVNLVELANSSLNFLIYAFTKTTDTAKFQDVQQDIFLKTIDIISQHGAECAFSTTTLHVPEGVLLKQQEK